MTRQLFVPSLFVLAAALGVAQAAGCGGSQDESAAVTEDAALLACHLTPAALGPGGHLHACDPQDVKKTTICHIPPGNPANAHTICVGDAAVPAHLANHGDYLGACQVETPCPTGAGGAAGGGGSGAGGAAGTGEVIVP